MSDIKMIDGKYYDFGTKNESFLITATNVTKAATVETGAVVQVPIFIEEGEVIQIDTRTGEYLGRSK